jgi:hypothetical protein
MHDVKALIARGDKLAAASRQFESAIVCPLVQGVPRCVYHDLLFWWARRTRFARLEQRPPTILISHIEIWRTPISQALRKIGVVAESGMDEFDTLGLGKTGKPINGPRR